MNCFIIPADATGLDAVVCFSQKPVKFIFYYLRFALNMLARTYVSASTAQHSTAQHSTAQHSTAQHSTAQHSTAQHSTAQHSTAQHSTLGFIAL